MKRLIGHEKRGERRRRSRQTDRLDKRLLPTKAENNWRVSLGVALTQRRASRENRVVLFLTLLHVISWTRFLDSSIQCDCQVSSNGAGNNCVRSFILLILPPMHSGPLRVSSEMSSLENNDDGQEWTNREWGTSRKTPTFVVALVSFSISAHWR